MGDIARCSLGKSSEFYNEDLLYDLFGVDAELLIDHAWGIEPCTMADIRPTGLPPTPGAWAVLGRPYARDEARVVLREMVEQLVLELVDKKLVTDAIVLHVGYDKSGVPRQFRGEMKVDAYGRRIPGRPTGPRSWGPTPPWGSRS